MADLDRLSAEYPDWRFEARWIGSVSGPGTNTIVATRIADGVQVVGLTEFEVGDKIAKQAERCP